MNDITSLYIITFVYIYATSFFFILTTLLTAVSFSLWLFRFNHLIRVVIQPISTLVLSVGVQVNGQMGKYIDY